MRVAQSGTAIVFDPCGRSPLQHPSPQIDGPPSKHNSGEPLFFNVSHYEPAYIQFILAVHNA